MQQPEIFHEIERQNAKNTDINKHLKFNKIFQNGIIIKLDFPKFNNRYIISGF